MRMFNFVIDTACGIVEFLAEHDNAKAVSIEKLGSKYIMFYRKTY